MLTRLKVNGFKNLIDVDVRFGPFTCVAGANGVGKSNLFDAIRFLGALGDRSLLEAALSVREEGGRSSDIRSLFHRAGNHNRQEMSFEAEILLSPDGVDEFGQQATATATFLRYAVTLRYRDTGSIPLEIIREELTPIRVSEARNHVLFLGESSETGKWWKSVIVSSRSGRSFISTDGNEDSRTIRLHPDGTGSRPPARSAVNLPRTVLSTATAGESPTAALARMELRSWQLLQLEPSAMRQPDVFTAPTRIGANGSHLAAALYRLGHPHPRRVSEEGIAEDYAENVYSEVANRLAELIEDIRDVHVDMDERRELYTLTVMGKDGTSHPARALSDGTLRFLALSVLSLDPETHGVICFEEPENGIHPARIPAVLKLLKDIACDIHEPFGEDNPLRQVIINTHSPIVVSQVDDNDLLVAEPLETIQNGVRFKRVGFSVLDSTWRARSEAATLVAKGKLLFYLNPSEISDSPRPPAEFGEGVDPSGKLSNSPGIRVMDRPDLQVMLPGVSS